MKNNKNFKAYSDSKKAYINGKIFTSDNRNSITEAVITSGNKIVYTGSNKDANLLIDKETEIIDLNGKLLLPGFIDNHTHFIEGGLYLRGLNLRPAKSKEEFVSILKDYISHHKSVWITGGSWNNENWNNKELPAKELIDPFTEDIPVFIERIDKHIGLANSCALRLAGITKETPSPIGGTIVKDTITGEPTGIIKDNAMPLIYSVIPPKSHKELTDAALTALEEAKRNGVTGIQDISLPEYLEIFQQLLKEDKLTCRIFARLPLNNYKDFKSLGIAVPFGNDKLKTGSLKAFADGSLGAGTAWFFDNYIDDVNNCGLPTEVVSNGQLEKMIIEADSNNLQVSVHAIGDRANSYLLDVFGKAKKRNRNWDRRFRIEHAQHVKKKDIKRFFELKVIASSQPSHLLDDGNWAEKKIGKERIKETYQFRTMLDEKVNLCFGSDWPVAPLNPLLGIYAAVTRETSNGKNTGGWVPEQKINVEEAIRCFTINSAYASFEENIKGSIEPGKLADFVVLDKDILTIEPEEIKSTNVVMTVLGGETIYTAN